MQLVRDKMYACLEYFIVQAYKTAMEVMCPLKKIYGDCK